MGKGFIHEGRGKMDTFPSCAIRSARPAGQRFLGSQFAASVSGRGIIACLLLIVAPLCRAASEPIQSRSFNGITAAFEIKNPIIRIGEDLKILVVYRNTSSRSVSFRFSHLDWDAELYQKGKTKPIIGGFVGEAPYREITLDPGESFRFEDVINMKGWPNLSAGNYEIRFCYHLSLLSEDSLIKECQEKYPHDGYVVPWSERRYPFTLIK
jgi:hypothetical protein